MANISSSSSSSSFPRKPTRAGEEGIISLNFMAKRDYRSDPRPHFLRTLPTQHFTLTVVSLCLTYLSIRYKALRAKMLIFLKIWLVLFLLTFDMTTVLCLSRSFPQCLSVNHFECIFLVTFNPTEVFPARLSCG